jgi:hypothetical protein
VLGSSAPLARMEVPVLPTPSIWQSCRVVYGTQRVSWPLVGEEAARALRLALLFELPA